MRPDAILAALLAAAVALAWARLAWRQTRADVRAKAWRITLLAAAQPVCAGLLYLTLMPPVTSDAAGTLVVATANTPRLAAADVALPEAPSIAGAERVPDLATALRRGPASGIRVVGDGLEARDRDAARGLALAFTSPAPPRGIVALEPPAPVALGGAVRVGGRVAGVPGGGVELLDPAGARVERRALAADGGFLVTGAARAAGVVLFRVVVRDARNRLVEATDVPVRTDADAAPRLLLLAGAASPEVKYLRRWAIDAGLTATARIAAGGGAVLGDAPVAVTAATLARFDVAVVDERSWAGLGAGGRAALVGAVRGGLGLVVRATGPVPAETRRQWRALGLSIAGGGATAPAPLASDVPILTRRVLGTTPYAVPVWRDARGAMLVDWRATGRGRVALWRVADAFALVLTGHADRYGQAWSDTLTAVARPRGSARATLLGLPRVGERAAVCGVGAGARIAEDDARLLPDPASGCAVYYPQEAGWRTLVDRGAAQPFYVHPRGALLALRAAERAEATAALRRALPARAVVGAERRGAAWPWFLALLAAWGALWWFERARWGRGGEVR